MNTLQRLSSILLVMAFVAMGAALSSHSAAGPDTADIVLAADVR